MEEQGWSEAQFEEVDWKNLHRVLKDKPYCLFALVKIFFFKSRDNSLLCYTNGFVLMRAFRITKNHHLRSKIEEIMALYVRRLIVW